MRHQTRECGEATHSVISLSMLRLGRMEKYSPDHALVRSPQGWLNQIELRAHWISSEVGAREE
jgi:hypothetical protein